MKIKDDRYLGTVKIREKVKKSSKTMLWSVWNRAHLQRPSFLESCTVNPDHVGKNIKSITTFISRSSQQPVRLSGSFSRKLSRVSAEFADILGLSLSNKQS